MAEPLDRFKYTTLAHHSRTLLGPLSSASVDAHLKRVQLHPHPGRRPAVLDVGCGKGEILVRAMKALGATGTGVDPNPTFASAARARGHAAGVQGDLVVHLATFAGAPIPRGSFDLVICTGASHAFGDFDVALAALAGLARPNGWALVGIGYWRQPPAAEYLEVFGGREDEMLALEETLERPARAGWKRIEHYASSTADWDQYEGEYRDAVHRWAQARPDDPDMPGFLERIEAWSAAYEKWGRETMGFVTMVLRR